MPRIGARIKQIVKKRHKLNLRALKFKDPDVKIHYNRFRTHVQRVLRITSWKYVPHSENMEFLKRIQRIKPTFGICHSNQPSHVIQTLTSPQKGLVRSPALRT